MVASGNRCICAAQPLRPNMALSAPVNQRFLRPLHYVPVGTSPMKLYSSMLRLLSGCIQIGRQIAHNAQLPPAGLTHVQIILDSPATPTGSVVIIPYSQPLELLCRRHHLPSVAQQLAA